MGIYGWVNSHHDSFGAQNAGGGAIGIEAVKSIPLLHTGEQNPVANDTESQVPQAPAKPVEREKEEKVSPNAVALKMRQKKRPPMSRANTRNTAPSKQIDKNQVFATQAPQVSNPLFSAMPGSGRIGTGATRPSVRALPVTPSRSSNWSRKNGTPATWTRAANRADRDRVVRSDARRPHPQPAHSATKRHLHAGLFSTTRHTGSKPVSADSCQRIRRIRPKLNSRSS